MVAVQCGADVRLFRRRRPAQRIRLVGIDRGRRRLELAERPADIAADRTAALQTMPCDHLVLYLYIIPHTLPADNEIDATRPFGIEVRISYAGRRLRTEKREINQWSGASVEMRVDSKK